MTDEDFESDEGAAEAASLPPRENPELVGHALAEAALLAAYNAGRLPHAWLITGPRGVGKATLAFRFARFLLAQQPQQQHQGALFAAAAPVAPARLAIPPDHPVFRRVASGGHPDLLVVERGYDRRGRLRSEIVVGDVRTISSFLRLTPAEGGWRVVIVDGADAMNRSASNAVLKILEEPPRRAVLLLVADNPGRLLPTVRSRCRRLALRPLDEAAVALALARHRPGLAPDDAQALARLSGGSIGRADALAAAGGMALYRTLERLIAGLPELDAEALNRFADGLSRAGAEGAFALVGELLPQWIARMVALAGGADSAAGEVVAGEATAMRRLAARRSLDRWAELWEELSRLFAEADALTLDKRQVVLSAFFALETAARAA
jgi:DNA polymerase III subunit delta'